MSDRHTFSPLRRGITLGLAMTALGGAQAFAGQPDPTTLLQRADAIRNPSKPFAVSTTLLEYKDGLQTQAMSLRAYSSAGGADEQFRSLVEILAPAQDKGKLILKDGTSLWMFDSIGKATIRVSPQQRLLGQAANGDVVTTNLAYDYKAEMAGAETIVDGERKSVPCYKLELSARTPQSTYHRVNFWVAQDNSRPVKAEFFVESGVLLKTAFYRRVQTVLGVDRPTETVMIDGLDPKWITVMRFSEYDLRDIPEAWLQRDYLPRFKAQ